MRIAAHRAQGRTVAVVFDIFLYLWYITSMDYALKERIGKPNLFVGRSEELAYYLKWISGIKDEKSQSTAMLARRKMGKTAIMERLFNITFYQRGDAPPSAKCEGICFFHDIGQKACFFTSFYRVLIKMTA